MTVDAPTLAVAIRHYQTPGTRLHKLLIQLDGMHPTSTPAKAIRLQLSQVLPPIPVRDYSYVLLIESVYSRNRTGCYERRPVPLM